MLLSFFMGASNSFTASSEVHSCSYMVTLYTFGTKNGELFSKLYLRKDATSMLTWFAFFYHHRFPENHASGVRLLDILSLRLLSLWNHVSLIKGIFSED